MIFCPKCGVNIKSKGKFCPKCGSDLPKLPGNKFLYIVLIGIIVISSMVYLSQTKDIDSDSYSDRSSILDFFRGESRVTEFCGDGSCNANESCTTCIKDCGDCRERIVTSSGGCGDGVCSEGECELDCWSDCTILQCENSICEPSRGENCVSAPNDCKCVNGYCDTSIKECAYQSCGNSICESYETYANCPNDCEADEYMAEDLSDMNYPIIFVHGHSVDDEGGQYSINAFSDFQDKLASDGYYEDRGYILASDTKAEFIEGEWSTLSKPVSFRTTYYKGEYSDVLTPLLRDDNHPISYYADRLSDVVEIVRYRTGKNKVIIIAHSMGGLVSRKYIVDSGGIYVDELITIGTPNNGVSEGNKAGFGCEGLFGRGEDSPECDDMLEDSIFLEELRLSNERSLGILYLTIAGKACKDAYEEGVWGDGLIRVTSTELSWASNKVLDKQAEYGDDCFLAKLHTDLIHPSKVIESYNEVINFLQ